MIYAAISIPAIFWMNFGTKQERNLLQYSPFCCVIWNVYYINLWSSLVPSLSSEILATQTSSSGFCHQRNNKSTLNPFIWWKQGHNFPHTGHYLRHLTMVPSHKNCFERFFSCYTRKSHFNTESFDNVMHTMRHIRIHTEQKLFSNSRYIRFSFVYYLSKLVCSWQRSGRSGHTHILILAFGQFNLMDEHLLLPCKYDNPWVIHLLQHRIEIIRARPFT